MRQGKFIGHRHRHSRRPKRVRIDRRKPKIHLDKEVVLYCSECKKERVFKRRLGNPDFGSSGKGLRCTACKRSHKKPLKN